MNRAPNTRSQYAHPDPALHHSPQPTDSSSRTVDELIIAHASAASQEAAAALSTLKLPQLSRLLARLAPTQRFGTDEYDLLASHEAVLAADFGWALSAETPAPFAAWWACQDGVPKTDGSGDDLPWGLITPCHWLVGNDKITLLDPQSLGLGAAESRELFDALKPSFEAEGWTLLWGAPLRWYARHPVLATLKTASLDRAIGRNLDLWLRGGDPLARRLRRLQVEAQMIWHDNPVNAARESRGDLAVNSFWLSGCGPSLSTHPPLPAGFDERLRTPLLGKDWAAWCAAWQALDAGPICQLLNRAEAGAPVSLTLCGERHAQRYTASPRTLSQRWRALWKGGRGPDPVALLSEL